MVAPTVISVGSWICEVTAHYDHCDDSRCPGCTTLALIALEIQSDAISPLREHPGLATGFTAEDQRPRNRKSQLLGIIQSF